MSEPTPAPWTIIDCDDDDYSFAIIGGDGNNVADVYAQLAEYANADLIAAAPDLLAACEAALEWQDDYTPAKVTAQMVAAIAKARGDA